MTKTSTRIINSILILLILGVLTFEARLFFTKAEDADTNTPQNTDNADQTDVAPLSQDETDCITGIKSFMEVKRISFGDFIDQHFRSGKPTSELIPAAIERFRQYRKEINVQVNKFVPKDKKLLSSGSQALPACKAAVTEDFNIMKLLIREHVAENSYAKKSTRLIDKYKEVNEKLDKLNFTIGQMAGYFGAFAQRLSCFAKQCL